MKAHPFIISDQIQNVCVCYRYEKIANMMTQLTEIYVEKKGGGNAEIPHTQDWNLRNEVEDGINPE